MCGEQWDFVAFWKTIGMVIVEWECPGFVNLDRARVWGWKESGLRESQCRFWRTEWRSQRSSACPSSLFFPWQQCPLSNTAAMPAASPCEGRRQMSAAGMVLPCLPWQQKRTKWDLSVSAGSLPWWARGRAESKLCFPGLFHHTRGSELIARSAPDYLP